MNEAEIKQRLEEIQIRMRFLESRFGVKESQVVSFDKLDKSAYWQIVQEYENEVRQKIRSVAKEMKAEKEKRRTPLYDRRIAAAAAAVRKSLLLQRSLTESASPLSKHSATLQFFSHTS